MALLSVLTAAQSHRADLLVEAGESLAAQELPDGWEFDWVVQEDGTEPGLAEVVGRFPFGRYAANGEQLGIAATRNLGLARAGGELVHVLDCDDRLLPHALATAISAFAKHPDIHWVAGQADDLFPGDMRLPYPALLPAGVVERGVVGTFVLDHGHTPVPCGGITARSATVRALGGWAAVPRAEDLALVVALSELAPGFLTPDVTFLYRRHLGQSTRQASWVALHGESQTVVRQRLQAVRALGLRAGA
ncbi:glycosyltransferase family 2 protein [Saccharothrix deserti]|uniref:glycosyltransferase family 2 protein n=1 Tax=Saccharothrix deserti TaxID=2593674 RepID=UPI00131B6DE3|nr:glycosyltransferase family 2 protein [Saccharothrix deserti]